MTVRDRSIAMAVSRVVHRGVLAAAVLAATVTMPQQALAEEAQAMPEAPALELGRNGVGFAGGGTSGIGFAWRNVHPSGYGFQLGGSVWVPSFEPPSGFWSFGLQGIKVIDQTEWWRLYAIAGVQTIGQQRTIYDPMPPAMDDQGNPVNPSEPPKSTPRSSFDSTLNVGGGIGLEFGWAPGVTLAIELPIVIGYRFGERPGLAHFMPIPNVLLLYNF